MEESCVKLTVGRIKEVKTRLNASRQIIVTRPRNNFYNMIFAYKLSRFSGDDCKMTKSIIRSIDRFIFSTAVVSTGVKFFTVENGN